MEYSFTRFGLVRFNRDEEKKDNPKNYDPGQAMKEQLAHIEKEKEINKLQEEFDHSYYEEYEKAKYEKPEQEVMAYFKIYHHWPKGHPLSENE